MTGFNIRYDRQHATQIHQDIAVMQLPATARKRLFRSAGRRYLKSSRDNLRQQKNIDGTPFEKRKYGKSKLLKNMGKSLKFFPSSHAVTLTWPNKTVAKLGYRHQFGIDEVMTASRMVKIHGQPDYQAPATKKQAKALIEAGFTIAGNKTKKGKARRKKPSQRWILQNMSLGQAGLIIRILRRTTNPPQRWKIPVPARPFLGVTAEAAAQVITNELLNDQQRRTR